MALTTIPSELSSVSGISDSSTSTAITIDSSQNVTFAGNITTGSNTISGVLSSVTGSLGSAATATTQAASDNSTKLATTAYVTTALANMVDSAPSTLDTLNELAAALGDDANFSTTVTNSIATKAALAGATFTGSVQTTGASTYFISNSSSSGDYIRLYAGSGTGKWDIYGNGANLRIGDNDSAGSVVIDTNVGIGTSSAGTFRTKIKHSAASVTTGLGIEASANDSVLRIFHSGSLAGFNATYSSTGAYVPMVFNVGAGGEAMRIDSSGNLLVGKTTTALATAGLTFGAAGFASLTRSGAEPLNVNRLSSDGSLVVFYKDGSTVGSIGSVAGVRPYFSSPNTGISPYNQVIYPVNGSGAITDGTTDIGHSSSRFKDLHLSGTAFTGSIGINQSSVSRRKLEITDQTPGLVFYDTNVTNLAHELVGGGNAGLEISADFNNVGSGYIRFDVGGSEAARIDSSGNVGIGAAPDTTGFGGTFKYLGVNGGSGYGVFNGQTSSTTANEAAASFFGSTTGSSGNKLLGGMQVINGASSASNAEGNLVFYTATGGALSERLRIAANGGLTMNGQAGSSPIFEMINNDNEDTDTGRETSIRFSGHRSGGEDVINAQITANHDGSSDNDNGQLYFYTNNGSALNLALKIRNNAQAEFTGSVKTGDLIGTSGGLALQTQDGTKRQVINNNGGILVGSSFASNTTVGNGNIAVSEGVYVGAINGNNQIRSSSAGGGSATLYIGNAAIQVSSDQRLKTNIVDTEMDATAKLNQVRVVDFNWDDPSDTSFNNRNARGKWTGVLAQELVDVLPFAVNAPRNESDLSIDTDSEQKWLVDQAQMVPVLIKAIQELTARIEELENN